MRFCKSMGFISGNVTNQTIGLCYYLSLTSAVDESSSNKKMNFYEFIEALARLSEVIDSYDPDKSLIEMDYSKEKPLYKKMNKLFESFAFLNRKTRR